MIKYKCKNWKKYKGIRKPICGCTYCNTFYTIKQDLKEFEDQENNEEIRKKIIREVEAKLLTILLN